MFAPCFVMRQYLFLLRVEDMGFLDFKCYVAFPVLLHTDHKILYRCSVVGVLHWWLYKELLNILYWELFLRLNLCLNSFKVFFDFLEHGDGNWMIFLEIDLRSLNVSLYIICVFSYKSIIPARSFIAFLWTEKLSLDILLWPCYKL